MLRDAAAGGRRQTGLTNSDAGSRGPVEPALTPSPPTRQQQLEVAADDGVDDHLHAAAHGLDQQTHHQGAHTLGLLLDR